MLEVSHKSIRMIEKRFTQHRQLPLWVPDWDIYTPSKMIPDLDVLLMGSFFERIFQPEHWPDGKFNFFSLSSKSRQSLIELYGFEQDVVGLINRNTLFASSKTFSPFKFNENSTLVYAGRISPQKNIEFLIFTVFYLQIFSSPHITLKLLGNFDSVYHRDILGCNFKDYQKKINALISQLPWPGEKPEIISDLNEDQWLKHLPENGFFISTSNLISEDFSVTAAQLFEIGYPMLLPNWGGFSDVHGPNIKHFSEELISNSHQSISTCSDQAKKFAKLIINKQFLDITQTSSKDIIPSQQIDKSYLENIYQINLKKWGKEIQLLRDKKMSVFALTENGQHFFGELRKLFAR